MYAKIVTGAVAAYPVNLATEFPNTSFPAQIAQSCLPDGYVVVAPAAPPDLQWYEVCAEGTPTSVNNVWTQTWAVSTRYTALADAKSANIARLSGACAAAIVSGFTSSALGAPYTYPSKQTDQANLNASVTAAMYPNLPADWITPFWCEDASGVWAWRDHTAAQILQVGADGKAAVLALQTQNATLAAQVNAATTIAAAVAVNWALPAAS